MTETVDGRRPWPIVALVVCAVVGSVVITTVDSLAWHRDLWSAIGEVAATCLLARLLWRGTVAGRVILTVLAPVLVVANIATIGHGSDLPRWAATAYATVLLALAWLPRGSRAWFREHSTIQPKLSLPHRG